MTLAGELAVDLEAIVANWRALDAMSAPEVETAAVVKADAYGCGAARVGPALARAGARTFFVALPGEGASLRAALGPGPAIYVLAGYAPLPTGGPPPPAGQPPPPAEAPPPSGARSGEGVATSPPGAAEPPPPLVGWAGEGAATGTDAAFYRHLALRPVLNSAPQAAAWFRDSPGAPCALHLDTGMNRLGMEVDEFTALDPLPAAVCLVMSHFACADEPAHPQNAAQLAEFTRLTRAIAGIPRSLAATGGILLGPDCHFDLTRAGIGLYGGLPFAMARPAVSLHLPVLQIRDVAPGETVGYGATWTAARPSRVATLSGGYADGLIRAMGGGATAWLDGRPLPFVGRVSMDLITVDATDCPAAAPGAMAEILGHNQTIDDLAARAGTIGYEILTALGSRYRRRYRGA